MTSETPAASPKGVTAAAAQFDRRLADEQSMGRLPSLAAGVSREGALLWSGARGRLGIDPASRGEDRQYRVGSLTKMFTAVAVARLRDSGLLDFSDPLEQHLSGTPLGDRTIRQLLSHTGGVQAEIDGEWWERVPGLSWAELEKTFSRHTLRHPPGRRFHYSNLGYAILGELVARKRGTSWYEALRAEILDPLELHRTTYLPGLPYAQGYAVHPWADVVQPEPTYDAAAGAPAGQLWSTLDDLAGWAAFVAGDTGGVLHPDTLAEMREPHGVEDGFTWSVGYGLGFHVIKTEHRTLVGHGGSMPGFLAALYVDTDHPDTRGDGVVAVANATSGLRAGLFAVDLFQLLAQAEPRMAPEWRPAEWLDPTVLEMTGTWYWGPMPFVLRAYADGLLHLGPVQGRGRASRFRADGAGHWIGLDSYYAGEPLQVVRHPSGEISHLDLGTFVFTRSPYDPRAAVPGGVHEAGWSGTSAQV